MARNKFDVDETLETPFNIKHLLRAGVYIGRHKKKMILSLLFSAISAACSLLGPMLIQRAIDVSVPQKDYTELVVLAIIMLVSIVASVLFARARSKYMIVVGQEIIYDIRKDLFEHLQKLPFQFYDDRPHGKILTRVINYVNSVSDALSNGIINFVLEIFNLILIAVFMFLCDVRLSLIVMAGIPLFLVIVLLIKPAQRRAWQDVSNKSSNINAYLHESLDGMKITQAFTREEENRGIYEKLNKKCYQTWMKAQYTSNLVWYSVDNISTWVVGAMYLIGLWMLGPAMQIGTLIAISSYAWRFWQPILNLSNLYNTFINAVAYLERIFEMIDEPVTVDDAPGATERAAQASAEGVVQDLGYTATFPILLNIANEPTYFIPLKDAANLVKSYAMVNVARYDIVATGSSVTQCEQEYIRMLSDKGVTQPEELPQTTASGSVAEIRSAVLEGNSYYFLRLEDGETFYAVNAAENPLAVILNVGDEVSIQYHTGEGSSILSGTTVKKADGSGESAPLVVAPPDAAEPGNQAEQPVEDYTAEVPAE